MKINENKWKLKRILAPDFNNNWVTETHPSKDARYNAVFPLLSFFLTVSGFVFNILNYYQLLP